MATLYKTGHITVTNGSTKVYGVDTAWLTGGVKAKDLILVGSELCEISEVTSSTELTLTYSYNGVNISQGDYTVIMIARQVLTVELAEEIQKLIELYKQRESKISEIVAYAAKFKRAGLGVDSNNRIYQGPPESEPAGEVVYATEAEIDSLINDVYSH
ncbi:MAG: hypothetical protein IJQ47_11595 [Synergistaceae bacterium]|nr:hypothetical protein [Synergistaceae bacterium]